MKGLAPHTAIIFERVSSLECIKPFMLVGGTALSLQIGSRLSEDLDFMRWRTSKNERMDVNWPVIKKELETIGTVETMNLMDFDHVEFVVDGVKLSFYASSRYSPVIQPIQMLNNLRVADIKSIGVMKMEDLLRRANFRDYYDIYSILVAGVDINELMCQALDYSGHQLKAKQLMALLTNGSRFNRDSRFEQMSPLYSVTAQEIEQYIKCLLLKNR